MNLRKKEQSSVLQQLILIETLIRSCKAMIDCEVTSKSDDFDRYLKMAMNIDPNDPTLLEGYFFVFFEFLNKDFLWLSVELTHDMGTIRKLST